jgi:hypothetical protein
MTSNALYLLLFTLSGNPATLNLVTCFSQLNIAQGLKGSILVFSGTLSHQVKSYSDRDTMGRSHMEDRMRLQKKRKPSHPSVCWAQPFCHLHQHASHGSNAVWIFQPYIPSGPPKWDQYKNHLVKPQRPRKIWEIIKCCCFKPQRFGMVYRQQ